MQDNNKGIKMRMLSNRTKALWWALIWGSVLFHSGSALAHKVYIFAWVEGDRVYTDSYFPDKKKVMGGLVSVFDPAGRKLLEGKTDEQGSFSFKIPQQSDLLIVLDATMGHRGEFTVKAEELPGSSSGAAPAPEKKEAVGAIQDKTNTDLKTLERLIQDAVEAKLKPIERKLTRLEENQGPGFTEVVGGIGYIVGLMGIVLYFKNRRVGKGDTKAH